MQVINLINELQEILNQQRLSGKKIGFVPTMGALHEGHLSLIRYSAEQNEITIVSIYVNPTQFNDKNDLKNYPRDLTADCKMVESAGCDIVFAPTDYEMYPGPDTRKFDFGILGEVMEGKHRIGHFDGVAKIVTKLFDAVDADRAYFGEKDFQQLAIVRKLVTDLNYPVEIIACPIIREADGLAMSSRNVLLKPDQRKAAPIIYKTLHEAAKQANRINIKALKNFVVDSINSNPLLKLKYFHIVEPVMLQPIKYLESGKSYRACIAVQCGSIRLIDNMEIIL